MPQLVLSLFPGADLLGMAFEQEGFCVVRGPDILLGGDVRKFKAMSGKFDGVIGGPPCQMFSQAVKRNNGKTDAVNLIPEFERVVRECEPSWWLMENVPAAPLPTICHCNNRNCVQKLRTNMILDAACYGAEQTRKRRFTSNLLIMPVPAARVELPLPTVTATEHKVSAGSSPYTIKARASRAFGRRMTIEEINIAMGLPGDWQTPALTMEMAYRVRGNGVPLQMGRALAVAIKAAVYQTSNT
jgi:DNA (cytosine-5)-methyltransferase 1